MSNKFKLLFIIFFLPVFAFANDIDSTAVELTPEEMTELQNIAAFYAYADSIEQTLNFERGEIVIGDGIAKMIVPEGYTFLNGPDSDMILQDLWGNPPSYYPSLGMLFPEGSSIMSDSSFVINMTYTTDGYVEDEDAEDIDYDDLLETMKSDTREDNKFRIQNGYPTIEMIGWAEPPFYDSAEKKLYWAQEFRFDDAEENTLNYNIRILGREGYLELNIIGEMYVLPEVDEKITEFVSCVDFNEGYRYEDFDSSIDKVAAYGIGGLIAGKVLAKAGILAKIGPFLIKFGKFIFIGIAAVAAGVWKFFGGRKKDKVEYLEE